MKTKGYLTQCDAGSRGNGWNGVPGPCRETIRLSKPRTWRCDACIETYGPLPKEEL